MNSRAFIVGACATLLAAIAVILQLKSKLRAEALPEGLGPPEGLGRPEALPEGRPEGLGLPDGLAEALPEGLGRPDGLPEGPPEPEAHQGLMKIIAAFLLAMLGGNESPTAEDVNSILGSVGAWARDADLEFFFSKIRGKDINELIAAGREKITPVHYVLVDAPPPPVEEHVDEEEDVDVEEDA